MATHDFANGLQGIINNNTNPFQPATQTPFLSREEGSSSGTRTPTSTTTSRTGIVVFSGGSAANSLVDLFNQVREANDTTLSYVIPISDNGGSSSELIRVFGGPGIGDIRSRLVRLIPSSSSRQPDPGDSAGETETDAFKRFFNYRLPKTYAEARSEWLDIVESNHALWHGISSPKRELIRSFLNAINLEMLKRLRPSSRFDFSGASIGNLFLTGARLFTGSFESAIYLLSSICAVPQTISVLPVLNTNFACHIAAGLADGTVITGQNDISHPSAPTQAVPPSRATSIARPIRSETEEQDKVEDANLPGTLPVLRKPAIAFSKEDEEDLPARIQRIWYINPYGQEISLPANPRVVEALNGASCVVYSIGSLFTSLIPSLVLRDVGEAIASPLIRNKILILNGSIDRETGPRGNPFTALDFVAAIADACSESRGLNGAAEREEYVRYVTHVIYLDGPSCPKMEKREFARLGIETMRLYGPREGRYDDKALQQALEAIIGRKMSDKTRRNTLVG